MLFIQISKPLPLIFFFLFHPCFAWLCLWSRIGPGIKKHGYWKRKLPAFFPLPFFFPSSSPPDFCISHLARQQPRGRSFFCLGPTGFQRSMGGKSTSGLFANRGSESLPPRFAVAASEIYLHIHPPLCDITNKAQHERFVFVCVCVFFLKKENRERRPRLAACQPPLTLRASSSRYFCLSTCLHAHTNQSLTCTQPPSLAHDTRARRRTSCVRLSPSVM